MRFLALISLFGILGASSSGFGQNVPPVASPDAPPTPTVAPSISDSQAAEQSALQAASQPAPVLPTGVSVNYVLGADDTIHVDVWKQPTISGPLTVRPDGKVSLPLVGDLMAAGLTPMDLAAAITVSLKKTIIDPLVTVTVTAANSKRIFFIGEVLHSGPIPFTREMSMLQAISAAGGLTPYANKKHIYILRGETGNQKKIPFNYTLALKKGNEQGVVLTPGDTIVVP